MQTVLTPHKTKMKPRSQIFGSIMTQLLLFFLAFFLSRTSIFLEITPLCASSYLALGGGISPLLGAALGSLSIASLENIYILIACSLLKLILREERFDFPILFICVCSVWGIIFWLNPPVPQDIIIQTVSLLIACPSYFLLKKAYLAQFVKSCQLKFTKNETYASLFLLFSLISGIRSETFTQLVNLSDIIKFYLIAMAAYYCGIGSGAATGAFLGMLGGYRFEYSALSMSVYSVFGFFTGLFSKFSKFTALLGLVFSYVFSSMYFNMAGNIIDYRDIVLAGLFFYLTPKKLIQPYLERYTRKETAAEMIGTVNSITAGRLERLAKSFSGLSSQISRTQKNIHSMTKVSKNTLFDFVGERLCKKCTLRHLCWQEQYDNTADALTKAMTHLSRYGQLEEKNLQPVFRGRCVKPAEMIRSCKNFYELYRLNMVWKNKLSENTNAFKQQFIELSKIICELKQNIEANRYFDAELSGELYSALSNMGYYVKEAAVLKTASENFLVKLELKPCKFNESCFPTIKKIIEDILGVGVIRVDGGCAETSCKLIFKEGQMGKIEKRIQSISKRDCDPVGDSYIISEISQNKYLMALCDGMGSGKEASEVSTSVVSLLEEMLKAGFSEESAYRMLNSFLIASFSGERFSTLDFILIDTKKMTGKLIKNGGCPTYIKRNNEVIEISSPTMPAGIRPQKPFIKTVHLKENDMIFMVSDGVMDALPEEDWIYSVLHKNANGHLSETVDLICAIAQKDFEQRPDDITVLGVKLLPFGQE